MGNPAPKTATLEEPVVEAIDLFCGIGGLTHGLQQAEIKVIAGDGLFVKKQP